MKRKNTLATAFVASIVACQANNPQVTSEVMIDQTNDSGLAATLEPLSASLERGGEIGHKKPAIRSLCASDEAVLFSCAIKDSDKLVSMCASKDVAEASGYLYYAYGTQKNIELMFPPEKKPPDENFKRTQLRFAGNTGGYAYSFDNNGYKYIVYSISGASELEEGGVLVSRDDILNSKAKMVCQQGSMRDTDDETLLDLTLAWNHDTAIDAHGLPVMSDR